ncbi:MAG: hypothetical protein V1745_04145, partial [Patescibacteria group bacterium]
MTDRTDMNAEAFEKALTGAQEGRHAEGLAPFLETADALRRDAEAPMGRLDPATAANQRGVLMHMAETKKGKQEATDDAHIVVAAMPQKQEKPRAPKDPSTPLRAGSGRPAFRIPMWAMGGVGVLAVAVVAIGILMRGPVFFQGPSEAGRALTRILIPEARAADAFTLVAEEQDAAGADIGTSFRVTAKVDVTKDVLAQNLRIVPPVDVTVEDIGNREFRVVPNAPLEPGVVYRLAAATVVQKDDGSTVAREFSWAVQTKDVFRKLTSVPADQSGGVPVDTGIEITMSQAGWDDPAGSFTIEPKVEGRFETHGRSLVFLPSKPLEPGRIYAVTLRKGWKLAASDLALADDIVIRFETEAAKDPNEDRVTTLTPVGAFFEAAPDQEAFIHVSESYSPAPSGAHLTGFALTGDDAVALIRKIYAIPHWAYATGRRGDDFRSYAVKQAFEVDATLEKDEATYSTFLRLPGQKPGMYLVRIQATSTSAGAISGETWAVMQVTDAATYAIADGKETVLWVMNLESDRPLSSLPVTLEGVAGRTDENGIVRLPTPDTFTSTSSEEGQYLAIAQVGSGELSAIVPITQRSWWGYGYGPSNGGDASVGYVYVDRPLYRIGDTLSFFGLVQDRETKQGAASVKVRIEGSTLDWSTYRSKIYAEAAVTPDADGFFRGNLSWDAMAPGMYQVSVVRDGATVSMRSIEIRDVVKPAFTIDVTPSKNAMFAGDELSGQVRARLFDGTPLTDKKLTIALRGQFDTNDVTVTTDDAGIATFRFPTARQTCDDGSRGDYCWSSWANTVEARPVDAEEAEIVGIAYVNVWGARLSATSEISTDGSDATISYLVRRVDLSAAEGREERSVLTTPLSGVRLTGRVVERRWERIELGPEKSRYDIILKRVVPAYRYEMR